MTENHDVTAHHLRLLAGDGSIEWVTTPIHASMLLDAADGLDKLDAMRELVEDLWPRAAFTMRPGDRHDYGERMRGLGLEVD